MKDYQKRVVDEQVELDDKIGRLVGFIGTSAYIALDAGERARLESQLESMRDYSLVLGERIENFKKDGADFVCDSDGCDSPCYLHYTAADSFIPENMKCIFGYGGCDWKRVEVDDERE